MFDEDEGPIVKVLMEAKNIPENSIVTKKTGEKRYTLKNKINVYSADDVRPEEKVKLNIDGYFLFGARGSINQIAEDLELCWMVSLEELIVLLEDIKYGES